ncbi:LOW QUALITY PROTEIN: uncharacterized protein EMH_0011240 [Eimeria mitis]|uniref:Uncharacterized protein n=1 Tax=Eimeria mitis TaxID=44415 RepID=U6JT24_9EIME|nr:LOW QUALITY PROTEIN: uncharacterized protein EMH_0011240 [Eimeria mitis]CDJ27916.1 hypothetical protein EMH_0011240 [Eimeria mitis]
MQAAAAAELRTLQTSVQQAGWSGHGREIAPGEVALPIVSRILPQKRNVSVGGLSVSAVALAAVPQKRNVSVGGLSVSAVALAAVAAVTAVYLVLRCAVYLANASKSRVALRLLAGEEKITDKGAGEPCGDSEENRLTATATDPPGEELGTPDEQDLLKRALRYITELKQFILSIEPVMMQLNVGRRAKCVAIFSVLSLVEFSALYSLLEREQRAGMNAALNAIYKRLWFFRTTIGKANVTKSRHRHFKCVFEFLQRVKGIKPTASALPKSQRLLKIKDLLQLQESALALLKSGLVWLRESLESFEEANDGVQRPDAAVGPAAGAEGTAAAAVGPAAAAANTRVDCVLQAIQKTAYERREQVFLDPLVGAWLREVNTPDKTYGIFRPKYLEQVLQKSPKGQEELLEDLLKTPLGSGDSHREGTRIKEVDAERGAASSSESEAPSKRDEASPPESPRRAFPALEPLDFHHQGSREGHSSTGSAPVPRSPRTSTAAANAPSAAADVPPAPSAKGRSSHVQAPTHRKTGLPHSAPTVLPKLSPSAGAGRPRFSATFAAPKPATLPLVRAREPRFAWASKVSDVMSTAESSDPLPSPKPLPGLSPGSFRAAISAAAAYTPENSTWRPPAAATQAPDFSVPNSASWASPVSLGIWHPLAASQWSPGATAPRQGGFDRSPRPSWPLRSPPAHTISSRYPSSAGAGGASPLQRRVPDEGFPPGTGRFASAPSASRWHLPPSQPLSPSPWLPAEYRSASGTAGQEDSPEVDTWPFTSRVWGPLGTAPPVTGMGYFPTEVPDEPSHPEASSGHAQLAKRLEAAADQHLGEATPPWHPPDSSDSPK